MTWLADFHFLRPEWLLALIPLAILLFLAKRGGASDNRWQQVIPAALLQHLMPQESSQNRWPVLAFGTLWLASVLALAGPTWERQPQPVQAKTDHLVVIIDLSLSTLATDQQPNRLTRARQKLADLLAQRQEGYTALIAYSGDAHVVSPLTDDSATVSAMVPALDPFIMPALGSRPERAIQQAVELLSNARASRGRILLLTDDMTERQASEIRALLKPTNYALSIIALGTPSGGPIAIPDRGFLQDNRGQVIIPKVDMEQLENLALSMDGRYSAITLDGLDLERTLPDSDQSASFEEQDRSLQFNLWQDEGYWLVLVAIPLALWLYRRGAILALLPLLLLPTQRADAFEWRDLWQTRDQQAQDAYRQGNHEEAATLFENPAWKGSAMYRNGDYEGAAQAFSQMQSADGFYNLGNALAHQRKYEEALEAYDKALDLDPDHAGAKYNKGPVEELLRNKKKQQEQQGQQGDQDQQQQDQQNQQDQNQQNQNNEADDPQQNDDQTPQDPSRQDPSEPHQDPTQQDEEQKENRPQDAQSQPGEPEEQEQRQGQQPQPLEAMDDEQKQAFEQWLRRVPDDPGGLLRRKFELQHRERGSFNRQPDDQPIW